MTIRDSYSASIIVTLQLPIKYNPKIIHIVNQRYIRAQEFPLLLNSQLMTALYYRTMKSVTIIGVDLQSLMQTLEMLRHINVPFESNIGNVITVDSQSIVEFTDCRLIGNQGTHYNQYP